MKNIQTLFISLSLAVVLAGCDTAPTADATPPEGAGCLADSYQDLIGGTEENALDTLADLFLFGDNPPEVRYISPGQAVTMDYRTDRTNIALDENGIVTRVYCG